MSDHEQHTSGTETTPIAVAYPGTDGLRVHLKIGPAHLFVTPGAETPWLSGSYHDPSGKIPCTIKTSGATAEISQTSRWRGVTKEMPVLNLALGTGHPYALTLDAGAIDGSTIDLGGLPLTSAELRLAAGKVGIDVSAPVTQAMGRFHLATGATDLTATNLGQLNASEIAIEGGASSIRLDFGGAVQRDTQVSIKAGAAAVEISVPRSTAAKISLQSFLGSIDAGDGFMTREGAYWTEGALLGGSPVLTISTNVAVGSLKLRATG